MKRPKHLFLHELRKLKYLNSTFIRDWQDEVGLVCHRRQLYFKDINGNLYPKPKRKGGVVPHPCVMQNLGNLKVIAYMSAQTSQHAKDNPSIHYTNTTHSILPDHDYYSQMPSMGLPYTIHTSPIRVYNNDCLFDRSDNNFVVPTSFLKVKYDNIEKVYSQALQLDMLVKILLLPLSGVSQYDNIMKNYSIVSLDQLFKEAFHENAILDIDAYDKQIAIFNVWDEIKSNGILSNENLISSNLVSTHEAYLTHLNEISPKPNNGIETSYYEKELSQFWLKK